MVPSGGVGLDEGCVGEVEPAELSGKRGILRKEDGGGQEEEEEEEGERRHGGGLKGTAWGDMFCALGSRMIYLMQPSSYFVSLRPNFSRIDYETGPALPAMDEKRRMICQRIKVKKSFWSLLIYQLANPFSHGDDIACLILFIYAILYVHKVCLLEHVSDLQAHIFVHTWIVRKHSQSLTTKQVRERKIIFLYESKRQGVKILC